jgi:hypothetical protein
MAKKEVYSLYDISKESETKGESRLLNVQIKEDYISKSKEFLEGRSVEYKKHELVSQLEPPLDEKSVSQIISLNEKILLPFISQLEMNLKNIDLKDFRIDHLSLSSEKKANKIIMGLTHVLSENMKRDLQLEEYMGKGELALKEIEEKLSQMEVSDRDELKKLSILRNEAIELRETLTEEDRILMQLQRAYFSKSMLSGIFKKRLNLGEELIKLKSLVSKELKEHNEIISELGEIHVSYEKDQANQVLVFEKEELEIDHDLLLLFRQYESPRTSFDSMCYICYLCSIQEAISILREGSMLDSMKIYSSRVLVGDMTEAFQFSAFFINKITSFGEREVAFVFPVDWLVRDSLFFMKEGAIHLYHPQGLSSSKLEERKKVLANLPKELEKKYQQFLHESKKLDDDFTEKFSSEVYDMLEKNFVAKWMKEGSEEYRLKNDIDAVKMLIAMRRFNALQAGKQLSKENALEEIEKLQRTEFNGEVKKLLVFYDTIIAEVKRLKLDNRFRIGQCLVIAPNKSVLYLEGLFEKEKTRPSVIYYDGELDEKRIDEYVLPLAKLKGKDAPKTRMVPIFEEPNLDPLQVSIGK